MTKIKPVNKRKNTLSALRVLDNTARNAYDMASKPISAIVDGLSDALGVVGKSTGDVIDKIIDYLPEGVDPNSSATGWLQAKEKEEKSRRKKLVAPLDISTYLKKKMINKEPINRDEYVNFITNGETPTWEEFESKKTKGIYSGDTENKYSQWTSDLKNNSKWDNAWEGDHADPPDDPNWGTEFIMPRKRYGDEMFFGGGDRPVTIDLDLKPSNHGEYDNDWGGDSPTVSLNTPGITLIDKILRSKRSDKYYPEKVIGHEMQHWLDHDQQTWDPFYRVKPTGYYYKQLLEQKAHAAEASAAFRRTYNKYPFEEADVDKVYDIYLDDMKKSQPGTKPINKEAFKILFRTVADNSNTEQDIKDILSSKEDYA